MDVLNRETACPEPKLFVNLFAVMWSEGALYTFSNHFSKPVTFAERNSVSKPFAEKFSYFKIENAYMKQLNNQGHGFLLGEQRKL